MNAVVARQRREGQYLLWWLVRLSFGSCVISGSPVELGVTYR